MILAILALAQMPWTANLAQRGVALDVLRPKFQFGGTSLTSVAAYVSGRFPTGRAAIRWVGQRTINEVGASLGFADGNVRPAAHIIVPLDDEYNAIVGVALGFGVAVAVK